MISFVPEDQRAYEIGLAALESFDDIPSSDDLDSVVQSLTEIDAAKVQAWKEGHETIESAGISMTSKVDVRDIPPSHSSSDGKSAETRSREISGAKARGSNTPSASLHQAIRKYQKFIRQEFHRPETDQVTAWGRTQVCQLDTCRVTAVNTTRLNIDSFRTSDGRARAAKTARSSESFSGAHPT
ncbi:hypothetical protein [Neorhodopirellula pilleata]|uniref:Uncharacterized protein n=1 Tax=Neorhodopirellula pilleata TaxID=2714738 RepID=A0A5C6A475_9BACT|nr:hypothetical protein [Neorhodopirellula pilleata]TWT94147.1 hypothetical protein Pla100_37550 [Neorhodopirellula pilleata]